MLANLWDTTEKKEMANNYYARLVRNYPLSPLVPEAKNRLKAHGAPVPQADPNAVAWMTAEQNAPRQKESLIKKPLGLIHSGPGQELRVAATSGKPTMTPASESEAGIDILTGGGNQSRGGGTGTGIVATIVPGSPGGTTNGAENVAPATEGTESNGAAQPDPNAPAGSSPNTTATSDSPNGAAAATGQAADAAKTDGATAQDATQTGTNGDTKKESTSKKKKGIKKIIPW
jgi:hypothetical protein